MTAVAWSAIGLLAATLIGNPRYLGSRLDAFEARLERRLDVFEARLSAKLDAIAARTDAQLERHAG
jgi:hypothetical protein